MAESSPNYPELSEQVSPIPEFRGRLCVNFVGVVFAIGVAFILFDTFLQLRRVLLLKQVDLFLLSRSMLSGFALTIMAFLLWDYSRAIRDYSTSGESGASQLERAHIDVWRWGAILLAAHLLHAAVFVVARMPF